MQSVCSAGPSTQHLLQSGCSASGLIQRQRKKLQLGSLVPNLLYRLFFGKRHFSNTFCLGRIFSNRAQAGDATRRGARKVLFKHDDNVLVAKETISRHWSQIRSQTWSFRTGPGEQLGSWFISSSAYLGKSHRLPHLCTKMVYGCIWQIWINLRRIA